MKLILIATLFLSYRTALGPRKNCVILVTLIGFILPQDCEEEAWHQFASRARWKMDRKRGCIGPLLPPQNALRDYTSDELFLLDQFRNNSLVGNSNQVSEKLNRLAEVNDIMGAVVFLSSDASNMVTGSSLMIDGGWTAG